MFPFLHIQSQVQSPISAAIPGIRSRTGTSPFTVFPRVEFQFRLRCSACRISGFRIAPDFSVCTSTKTETAGAPVGELAARLLRLLFSFFIDILFHVAILISREPFSVPFWTYWRGLFICRRSTVLKLGKVYVSPYIGSFYFLLSIR